MSAGGVSITFEMQVKPDLLSAFLEGLPGLVRESSQFPGFRSMRVVQHKDDPTRLLLIECWESQDAYDRYIAWRTERGDMERLADVVLSTKVEVWPTLITQV